MNFENFIFDLDGTLLDTLRDLQEAVNFSITKYGYEKKSYEQIRNFVGNGVSNLLSLCIPYGFQNENFDNIIMDFKNYYNEHNSVFTKPYDDIIDILKFLKNNNKKVFIVSNKSDNFVKILAKKYFDGYIDYALGETENFKRKPSNEMCKFLIKKFNLDINDTVYIGDSEIDILTAKNSNLPLICVTWGFREKTFLSSQGAEIFIDNPNELKNFI